MKSKTILFSLLILIKLILSSSFHIKSTTNKGEIKVTKNCISNPSLYINDVNITPNPIQQLKKYNLELNAQAKVALTIDYLIVNFKFNSKSFRKTKIQMENVDLNKDEYYEYLISDSLPMLFNGKYTFEFGHFDVDDKRISCFSIEFFWNDDDEIDNN